MAKLKPHQFTPSLCKAARALLDWTAADMAEQCTGIGVTTLRKFEADKPGVAISDESRDTIREALESAGVEFINGGSPGVRLTKQSCSKGNPDGVQI